MKNNKLDKGNSPKRFELGRPGINLVTSDRRAEPIKVHPRHAFEVTIEFANVVEGGATNRFSCDVLTSSKKNIQKALAHLEFMGAQKDGEGTRVSIFHPVFGRVAVNQIQVGYYTPEGELKKVSPSIFQEMDGGLDWGDENDEEIAAAPAENDIGPNLIVSDERTMPLRVDPKHAYELILEFAAVEAGRATNRFSYDSITSSEKNIKSQIAMLQEMGVIDESGEVIREPFVHPLFGRIAINRVQIAYFTPEGEAKEVELSVFQEMDGGLDWGDEEPEPEGE